MAKAILKNVDIIDTLQKITDNNTSNYSSDFEYDKQTLIGGSSDRAGYFWMSRNSGTWMFPERDVYILQTSSHNTWSAYSEKNDNVKAFFVEVQRISEGKAYGDIIELDYEKHLDYLVMNTVKPKEVRLTFKDSMRNFSMNEYNTNFGSIRDRYGLVVDKTFLTEHENNLRYIISMARLKLAEEAVPTDVDSFMETFKEKLFEKYNYHQHDKEFVNTSDANAILKYGLNLYALTQDGVETKIHDNEEFNKHHSTDMIFCTNDVDKGLLKHLQEKAPSLFSEEENEILLDCVLQSAKENKIENLVALDKILYKLEHLMPKFSSDLTSEAEQELERE